MGSGLAIKRPRGREWLMGSRTGTRILEINGRGCQKAVTLLSSMVPLEFKVLEHSKDEARVWRMRCRNIVGVEWYNSKANATGSVPQHGC